MKQTKVLIDGAISATIFSVILLITLHTPLLGSITTFFVPLPMIYYAMKHGLQPASVTLFVFIVLSFLIGGPITSITTLVFTIPGLVIGVLYKRQSSAFTVMVAASLTFIGMLILIYIGAIVVLNINFIHILEQTLTESMNTAKKVVASLGAQQAIDWAPLEKQIKLFKYFIPTLLVTTGVFTTTIILLVSQSILKRLGMNVPKFPSFRDWSFPKSLLWYYLFAFIGILFLNLQQGSVMFSVFYNVFSLLEIVMIIQGFSFVFYYAHYKKLNKSIPIIVVVLSFLIPQLVMFLIRLLGIIDLGFNLRKRLT